MHLTPKRVRDEFGLALATRNAGAILFGTGLLIFLT
jgi:hypothetical protein